MKEVLMRARVLVEMGWTQGAYSRDADGRSTSEDGDFPTCFCSAGAIFQALGEPPIHDSLVEPYIKALGFDEIGQLLIWNDQFERTKDQVLARFDEGIKRC